MLNRRSIYKSPKRRHTIFFPNKLLKYQNSLYLAQTKKVYIIPDANGEERCDLLQLFVSQEL
jgi:hypothetical protein